MKYNLKRWSYFILFVLILACAKDEFEEIYTIFPTTNLEIKESEGLKFENSYITNGSSFNLKVVKEGDYILEIKDVFKNLVSKSIITAQVGDNVMKFYTKALQNSDYIIVIKKDDKTIYNVKYNIQ
tara:strand:- start:296 stop:673 length:378 start_codon:yes stop_codon:yes gene_type:complete